MVFNFYLQHLGAGSTLGHQWVQYVQRGCSSSWVERGLRLLNMSWKRGLGLFIFQLSRCDLFSIKHWESLHELFTIQGNCSLPSADLDGEGGQRGFPREGRVMSGMVLLVCFGRKIKGRTSCVFLTRLLSFQDEWISDWYLWVSSSRKDVLKVEAVLVPKPTPGFATPCLRAMHRSWRLCSRFAGHFWHPGQWDVVPHFVPP